MKLYRLAPSVLALALGASGLAVAQAYGPPQGPPPPGYDQDRHEEWNVPPQEFQDIQRRGFHDGVEGARKDFGNHRRPDVENREEFRHPNVSRSLRREYREGFRRGYQTAWAHIAGGPR
jgi:hypothetical protein